MTNRLNIAAVTFTASLGPGACANNYVGEGALGGAVAGAARSIATGGDLATGAAVGAAVGGAGSSLIRKNGNCYRVDNRGREHRVRYR